ncbi:MAG: hypothetical protein KAX38_07510, partial [Candidatus Krumholzibacteria bacterium]|nr:hypothetical protein [Candidatus Krumholzibacteria bacterium]
KETQKLMSYKKMRYAIFLVPLITTLMLHAISVSAQNIDSERVKSAIEVTNGIIEKADEVIGESRSQKARLTLAKAKEIQAKAIIASCVAEAYGWALKLTLEARKEAYHALGLARLEAKAEARLSRVAEETLEHISRARDLIIEGDLRVRHPIKLIEEARNLLEKSRLNAHQYRYQLALKLAENALQRAIRAEQQVRRAQVLKEMTERRLALLEKLINRANERVRETENRQARARLRMANEQLERAKELLREGRYNAAKHAMEKCEKILRSLIRQFGSQALSDPDALMNEAYRLLERAEEILAGSGEEPIDPQASELAGRARELLRKAEEETSNGRFNEARRLTEQSLKLLRKTISEGKNQLTREKVASSIHRVEDLREETLTLTEGCTAPGIGTLMERAFNHLEKARALLDDSRLQNAEAEARIARNIYNRIKEICSI